MLHLTFETIAISQDVVTGWIPFAIMGASAIANAVRGGIQGKKARGLEQDFQKKDAALQPVSPDQIAFINQVQQQERAARAGTDAASSFAARGVSNAGQQTRQNILRAGGSGVVGSLLRSQAGQNTGYAGIGAQAAGNANRLMQYRGGLIDNVQRSLYNLQMKRRNYAQALAAQTRQGSIDSATAAIASAANAAMLYPGAGGDFEGGENKNMFSPPLAENPQTSSLYTPRMANGSYGNVDLSNPNQGVGPIATPKVAAPTITPPGYAAPGSMGQWITNPGAFRTTPFSGLENQGTGAMAPYAEY